MKSIRERLYPCLVRVSSPSSTDIAETPLPVRNVTASAKIFAHGVSTPAYKRHSLDLYISLYIHTNKFSENKNIEKCFACSMHYYKTITVATFQYFLQKTSYTCHPFLHDMFGIWRHFSGQSMEMFESIRGVFPRPEKRGGSATNSAQSFGSLRWYISIKELNKGSICRNKVFLFEVILLLKNIKCILRLVGW